MKLTFHTISVVGEFRQFVKRDDRIICSQREPFIVIRLYLIPVMADVYFNAYRMLVNEPQHRECLKNTKCLPIGAKTDNEMKFHKKITKRGTVDVE